MILADTSVLIDYFKGVENPAADAFDGILTSGASFGIAGFIYQELLQGARTASEFDSLKTYLQTVRFYDFKFGLESFERAAYINFACRRAGVTIRSTVDLAIAQIAIENDLYLLHNDKDFDKIARVVPKLKIYDLKN